MFLGTGPARREQQYSPAVRDQIQAAEGVGTNVLAYATNREVKFKLEGLPSPASDHPDTVDRGKLYVASILHSGGCNAAPARWPRCCDWPPKSSKCAPPIDRMKSARCD